MVMLPAKESCTDIIMDKSSEWITNRDASNRSRLVD